MNLRETLKHETLNKTLLKERNISLEETTNAIQVAIYMALVNGQDIVDKFQMIESYFVEYLKLEEIFNDKEIDDIFLVATGETNEKEDEFVTQTIKEIQTHYLVFVANCKNLELKYALIDLLEQLESYNGEASIDEILLSNLYIELFNSETYSEHYADIVEKIDTYRSNYIYARGAEHTTGWRKKFNKALKTYAHGLKEDDIIALYDSTIFGGADEGFVITKWGILTTQDEDFSVIPFAMMYEVTYDNDAMSFFFKADENAQKALIGYIPRIDNLRILATLLSQIADINVSLDKQEKSA